ncbi:MAG: DUF3857 domain-containing protein [Pelagibacterales bacterium]|nr:DUF3857 domain-containing protein [Pelagibacterales bacterium]
MKNIVFIIILFTYTISSYSQYYKDYSWKEEVDTVDVEAAHMNESSVGVFEKTIIEFVSGKFSNTILKYETHHYQIKVLNNKGVSKHSNIVIPMNEVTNLKDIRVRIIDENGELSEFDNNTINELGDSESSVNFKNFHLAGVKTNSTIEVLYTLEKQYNIHGNKILQKSYSIKKSEFLLIPGPTKGTIKTYSVNSKVKDTIISTYPAKTIKVVDIPAIIDEEYATAIANRQRLSFQCPLPDDNMNQEDYWENIVSNISPIMFPKNIHPKIFEVSSELIQKNEINEYNIANKIDDYVKNNFTISENDNVSLNNIDYILENKTSNDFSIIQVYTQLLTAAGINYEIVITSNRYYNRFDSEFFDPNMLREFLIYFPKEKKYIAPNRLEYRIGEAPFDLLGNYGIYIDRLLDFYFSEIIQSDKSYSKIKRNIKVEFERKLKKIVIDEYQEYSGHWATNNRSLLSFSDEEGLAGLKDYLTASGIENKKVINYEIINAELFQKNYNTPFIVNSKISTESLTTKIKNGYQVKIGNVIGMQSQLYENIDRFHPIEITYPNQYDYRIVVKIPKGYSIEGLEGLVFNKSYISLMGNKICKFESNYEINENELVISIQEFYKTLRYQENRYNEFRDVINSAADFYNTSIRFIKK